MKSLKEKFAKSGGLFSALPVLIASVVGFILLIEAACEILDVDLMQKIHDALIEKETLLKIFTYILQVVTTYLSVAVKYMPEFASENIRVIIYIIIILAILYSSFNKSAKKGITIKSNGTVTGRNVAIFFAVIIAGIFTALNFSGFKIYNEVSESVSEVSEAIGADNVAKYFAYGFLALAILGFVSTVCYLLALITKANAGLSSKGSAIPQTGAPSNLDEANERIAKLKALKDAGTISSAQYDDAVNDILKRV